MSLPAPSRDEVAEFGRFIAAEFGLASDASRLSELAELLRARARVNGDIRAYLDLLQQVAPAGEVDALAEALTVNETFFFRNAPQFDVLTRISIPDRVRAREGGLVNIASIGCASGEEPYTVAMVARDSVPAVVPRLSIRAVDVNPAVLTRARAATFSNWSLRNTPERQRARWFRGGTNRFVLHDEIRGAVTFDKGNLTSDDTSLWPGNHYDIVFCRNVLMYFEAEAAQRAVERIARSMVPGGFLFLGEAETLRGLSNAFTLCHAHGAFYYQRSDAVQEGRWDDAPAATIMDGIARAEGDAWVEAIRVATARIDELANESSPAAGAAPDVAGARALIHDERFDEALRTLARIGDDSDADVLLLRAVSLVHAGDLAAGEMTCRRLLQLDGFNAGAHYLLALCHEGRDDLRGARHHDEVALHLEPSFSMAQLHLGLLAQREGNPEVAHHELSEALVALQREDASRLLLFGGGFAREGLLSLCRAAIASCVREATA